MVPRRGVSDSHRGSEAVSGQNDLRERGCAKVITDGRDLRDHIVKYPKSVEQSEIGERRVHGDRCIAPLGQCLRQEVLCFIEEIAQNPVQAQHDRHVLAMQSGVRRRTKESVDFILAELYAHDSSSAIFDVHMDSPFT
jgi:hypothetical protein